MKRNTHAARPGKNSHSSNRSTGTYTPENTVCNYLRIVRALLLSDYLKVAGSNINEFSEI